MDDEQVAAIYNSSGSIIGQVSILVGLLESGKLAKDEESLIREVYVGMLKVVKHATGEILKSFEEGNQ